MPTCACECCLLDHCVHGLDIRPVSPLNELVYSQLIGNLTLRHLDF